MSGRDEIAELVEAVYDAAVVPSLWPTTVDRLMAAVQADSALLYTPDADPQAQGLWVASNLDPVSLDEYRAHYIGCDIWLQGWRQRGRDGSYLGGELAARSSLVTSEFYNDFLRRYDVQDFCGLVVGAGSSATSYAHLSFYREHGSSQFEGLDRPVFQYLVPHLRHATSIQARMAQLDYQNRELRAALDAIPEAVFLIDDRARIIHANREAENVLAAGFGLVGRGRMLRATATSDQNRLSAAILAAAGNRVESGQMRAISLSRDTSDVTLHLVLVPAGPALRGRVLVLADTSSRQCRPSLKQLMSMLFGLSAAEVEVGMALAAGQRLDDIAAAQGKSKNTVRTQLQTIFWKTQTSSQTDLIRLMLSIPAVRDDGR